MRENAPTIDPDDPLTADERIQLAEAASGIGTFEIDLVSEYWNCSPQMAVLFGLDPEKASGPFTVWQEVIFFDDVPKINSALLEARQRGTWNVEFRVRRSDGKVSWLACKGQWKSPAQTSKLRGACYDISERKALEARLLATNEVLDSRVAELREEARTLELLKPTKSCKDRPSRSTDHAAIMSNSRRVAPLSIRSKPGRLSRPFAPLSPASIRGTS